VNQLDPNQLGSHRERLYRVARSLCRSPHDAEDLVQETYVRILVKPRELAGDDPTGYLLRSLRNTFRSEWRTRQRRVQACALPPDLSLIEDRASVRPEAALEAKELREAVASLSEPYRNVLVAVDVAGLSYKEAAAACDAPTGTVMSRLYRARAQVAELLRAA
jgi:RNA polymerase sigma-70 factor, ECF subfamily